MHVAPVNKLKHSPLVLVVLVVVRMRREPVSAAAQAQTSLSSRRWCCGSGRRDSRVRRGFRSGRVRNAVERAVACAGRVHCLLKGADNRSDHDSLGGVCASVCFHSVRRRVVLIY